MDKLYYTSINNLFFTKKMYVDKYHIGSDKIKNIKTTHIINSAFILYYIKQKLHN